MIKKATAYLTPKAFQVDNNIDSLAAAAASCAKIEVVITQNAMATIATRTMNWQLNFEDNLEDKNSNSDSNRRSNKLKPDGADGDKASIMYSFSEAMSRQAIVERNILEHT